MELHHYRDGRGHSEVDVIAEAAASGQVIGVEVKGAYRGAPRRPVGAIPRFVMTSLPREADRSHIRAEQRDDGATMVDSAEG